MMMKITIKMYDDENSNKDNNNKNRDKSNNNRNKKNNKRLNYSILLIILFVSFIPPAMSTSSLTSL